MALRHRNAAGYGRGMSHSRRRPGPLAWFAASGALLILACGGDGAFVTPVSDQNVTLSVAGVPSANPGQTFDLQIAHDPDLDNDGNFRPRLADQIVFFVDDAKIQPIDAINIPDPGVVNNLTIPVTVSPSAEAGPTIIRAELRSGGSEINPSTAGEIEITVTIPAPGP